MWQRFSLVVIALLFFGLLAHRVWRYATFEPAGRALEMPRKVEDAEERALYLVPDGGYTRADIEANGGATPSQRFRGFQARHDYNPQPGDRLCPVTRTKANPNCAWVVGGQKYQFCCPPCINEFVRLAKERPEQVQPSESYVQR